MIAARTHTDLFEDVAPSVHIHKGWGERLKVMYDPNRLSRICSVSRGLRIKEGSLEDYRRLAEFHYGSIAFPVDLFTVPRYELSSHMERIKPPINPNLRLQKEIDRRGLPKAFCLSFRSCAWT